MWLAEDWKEYTLLDCGGGERLEKWGAYTLQRPDPQAIWPKTSPSLWKKADAVYHRSSSGGGSWNIKSLPQAWTVSWRRQVFNVKPMSFKHTGVFPEQAANWDFITRQVARRKRAGQRAQPVCLHRRGYPGCCCGRRFGLPCGRRQRDGCLGQRKCAQFRPGRRALFAISLTTARSLSSAKSGAGGGTTPSSWIPRLMAAGRRGRSGSLKQTSPPLSSCAPAFCQTPLFLLSSARIRRGYRRRCRPICWAPFCAAVLAARLKRRNWGWHAARRGWRCPVDTPPAGRPSVRRRCRCPYSS